MKNLLFEYEVKHSDLKKQQHHQSTLDEGMPGSSLLLTDRAWSPSPPQWFAVLSVQDSDLHRKPCTVCHVPAVGSQTLPVYQLEN